MTDAKRPFPPHLLLRLFAEMALLAATVLGGGYVILSVADSRFSKKLGWIREGELFDRLPLFQMVPGIIGGHTAVYVGNRVAGWLGAVVALGGMTLPSVIIFTVISVTYRSIPVGHPLVEAAFMGLRAALTGVMAEIVARTWRKSVQGAFGLVMTAVSIALLVFDVVPPGALIVLGMLVGVVAQAVLDRRGETRVYGSFGSIVLVFMLYGLMSFGGGFVLVPVFLRDFVGPEAPHLQLASADFANVVALTQMSPGPVAINSATFFGYELGGLAGAVVATLALVLPGLVILLAALKSVERFRASLLVRGIFRGVRPVTMALVISATVAIARLSVFSGNRPSLSALLLAVASFGAVCRRRSWAVPVILLSALASALLWLAAQALTGLGEVSHMGS